MSTAKKIIDVFENLPDLNESEDWTEYKQEAPPKVNVPKAPENPDLLLADLMNWGILIPGTALDGEVYTKFGALFGTKVDNPKAIQDYIKNFAVVVPSQNAKPKKAKVPSQETMDI